MKLINHKLSCFIVVVSKPTLTMQQVVAAKSRGLDVSTVCVTILNTLTELRRIYKCKTIILTNIAEKGEYIHPQTDGTVISLNWIFFMKGKQAEAI
jgi:hypothetical protein